MGPTAQDRQVASDQLLPSELVSAAQPLEQHGCRLDAPIDAALHPHGPASA